MRIPIREQLGLMVFFVSLIALMILVLAVWFQSHSFIIFVRLSALSLTASLKAAQLSSTLFLYQSSVQAISTRVLIQSVLQAYNAGNNTAEDLSGIIVSTTVRLLICTVMDLLTHEVSMQLDLQGALSGFDTSFLLMQAIIYPKNNDDLNSMYGIINATGVGVGGAVKLPYNYPNGSAVYLGDPIAGYPPALYPNLTYSRGAGNETNTFFGGSQLLWNSTVFIGPYTTNNSFSLFSVTVGINNNTSRSATLGWLTVVLDARSLYNTLLSPEGLGATGEVLIVGPADGNNKFAEQIRGSSPGYAEKQSVRFVLPPQSNSTLDNRHSLRSWQSGQSDLPFPMGNYTAVVDAWTEHNTDVNNAGALISSHNEQGQRVSVGYATVSNTLVDWVLIFEQSYDEVESPVTYFRNIILACVFGTTGALLLLTFPIAHFSVTPIRQLCAATRKTVEPYVPESTTRDLEFLGSRSDTAIGDGEILTEARKEGLLAAVSRWKGGLSRKKKPNTNRVQNRTFRIPGKVPERKHLVNDELTDLTKTFNQMSEELVMQYERLEQRVQVRTSELEKAKSAAEVANESKTLFIANISHELKTPLNGILGLCSVCMQEEDLYRIRATLNTIHKSGELLLHLLTDLLTFSKNSMGQQIQIDDAEFRLIDLKTQVLSIFEKQAREAQIALSVTFHGLSDAYGNTSDESEAKLYGPAGTGRVRDMCLYGDKNRILQVLMNFISNSLKFTPPNGSVEVRVRCVGLEEDRRSLGRTSRNPSLQSRQTKDSKKGRKKDRPSAQGTTRSSESSLPSSSTPSPNGVIVQTSKPHVDPMLSINVAGTTKQIPQIATRRSNSPPPPNTKTLIFDFEVEDTGPGIPEEQQKMIFEPFVQGDLGLSKKYAGTGLGLSICAQLANLMDGTITLKSTVGKGSTFAMSIPLRYAQERSASIASSNIRIHSSTSSVVGQPIYDERPRTPQRNEGPSDSSLQKQGLEVSGSSSMVDVPRIVGFSKPYVAKEAVAVMSHPKKGMNDWTDAESEAAKQGRKVRVLVAEDNQVNQEVVLRMLRLEDVYDVTIAKDGQEALDVVTEAMAKNERFDLVFMDIQMPNLDGIQSTKRIREMGFSAPIVALTAFAEESNIQECMKSGMDFFLPKPIRRPALKQVLKKYCATIPEEDGDGNTVEKPHSSTKSA